MNDERIVSPAASREEEAIEASIRPKRLDEYLGQAPVRNQMQIFIEAAKHRGEALDHVLIFGPPGLAREGMSIDSTVGAPQRSRRATKPLKPDRVQPRTA